MHISTISLTLLSGIGKYKLPSMGYQWVSISEMIILQVLKYSRYYLYLLVANPQQINQSLRYPYI